MIGRRSVLALMGSGVASAASGLSAKDVVGQAQVGSGVANAGLVSGENVLSYDPIGVSAEPDESYQVFDYLHRLRDQRRTTVRQMPPHLAEKKSWSSAFKLSAWHREEAEFEAMVREAQNSKEFRNRLMSALGLETTP